MSEIGRTLIGRLLPGTDLIPGLLSMCGESVLRYGYVASLIGSLSSVRVTYVRRAPGAAGRLEFAKPLEREGQFEILSAQGTIGENEDGTPFIHLHAQLCDEKGHTFGGHIMEVGNAVLATVEVVVRETRGIRLVRGPDEETGVNLFKVYSGF